MKKFISFFLLIGLFYISSAQDSLDYLIASKADSVEIKLWKIGGIGAIAVSQVSLTNWAAGGQNSLSGNARLNLFANYKKNNSTLENTFDLGYGFVRQGPMNTRKSDDKIDFTSKYGRKASKLWYYSGLINLKTQMFPGYKYPNDTVRISNFFAPAYIVTSIGMDYKPDDCLTLLLSPLTGKITIVFNQELADAGAFGVKKAVYDIIGNRITPGENLRYEFGGYLKMIYKKDLMENVFLQTKLDLFSNYVDKPLNIDISWEILITMKVNKYISASLISHLVYDDDIDVKIDDDRDGVIDYIGPKVQFKEVLGIGFSYKFN